MEASFSFTEIRSLYLANLGQAIPSAIGRYDSAATVLPKTPEEEASLKEILTVQETKVLRLIAGGLWNKEIAHRLNIKGETVKFHIKNMYRKLGVNNRVQALHRPKN
jgi:DNA-binding NarL/FixJ family response regulator